MRLIEFKVNNGQKNMQIDNDLLEFAIKNQIKESIFRLYGWAPACISLGRNQNEDFLNKELLRAHNIDVVRRLTGGRAILHDQELTYSYICPISLLKNGQSVVESYKEICQFLIDGFNSLGIELDFPKNKKANAKFDYCMKISTGADLCFEGKKFIGSAQFRKEGYILQHGSILLEYDGKLLKDIFNEDIDKNSLTSLKNINPQLSLDEVKQALLKALSNHLVCPKLV